MLTAISNSRNEHGVKYSSDMYRAGGERICWCDGYTDEITLRIVAEIRGAGFKAWRTGSTVWVRKDDEAAISARKIGKA